MRVWTLDLFYHQAFEGRSWEGGALPVSYSWRSEPHIPPQAIETIASLSFAVASGTSTTRTSRVPKYCAALMIADDSNLRY